MELKFIINDLHPALRSTAKSMLQYWLDEKWYDPANETFSSEKIIDIINETSNPNLNSDELDLHYTTLDLLVRSTKNSTNNIIISGSTFWGSKNFKFLIQTVKNDLQSKSPIFSSIENFILSKDLDTICQLKKLVFLKKASKVLNDLNFSIILDKNLSSRNVNEVIKAEPKIEEATYDGKPYYNLNYTLTLSDNSKMDVKDSDFFGNRKYLEKNKQYVILPDEIYSAIELQRKNKGLSLKEISPFILKPTASLFPVGTDLSLFDLSQYDARIASFEYMKKIHFSEIVSSNIEWYKKDNENIPLYKIRNKNGNIENLELTPQLVDKIISKADIEKHNINNIKNSDLLTVHLDDDRFITLSEENLQSLKQLTWPEKITETDSAANKKSIVENNKRQVAVIKSIEHSQTFFSFPNVSFIKEDFVPFLNDGVILDQHQIDGINWLINSYYSNQGGVLLADDMGLGKTLQIILFFVLIKNSNKVPKLINLEKKMTGRKISMIVAPLILLENWNDEFKKFIEPNYLPEILILHGKIIKSITKNDGTLNGDWWTQYDLIVTNYNTFSYYQIDLLKLKFMINVFDESQNIKNPNTAQARAARGLNTNFAICATGTPVENSLIDLWSQIDSLNRKPKNPLGNLEEFQNENKSNINIIDKTKSTMRFNLKDALILRRDKALLKKLNILKDKIITDPIYIEMNDIQKFQEQNITINSPNKSKIFHDLQILYQHPALLSDNFDIDNTTSEELINGSPKLRGTIELLEKIKAKKEKVLIFAWRHQMQFLMKKVFDQKFDIDVSIINGDTNKNINTVNSSKKIINIFSSMPGFNILILSPIAAGAGLNITEANHVIHYGRWWNPAKEDQATDRAYRKGQKKNVYVYYPILVTTDSKGNKGGFDYKLHHELINLKRNLSEDFLKPIDDFDIKNIKQKNTNEFRKLA